MGGISQRSSSIVSTMAFAWVLIISAACCCIVLSATGAESPETGDLPVLVFQTDGKAVQDRTRTPTTFTMLVPGTGRDDAFSASNHNGRVELSARGNTSYYFPKKSYRLELQGDKGKDRKASLLGMPADSDWVLYASVTDRTFARNLLGHELWRSMGRYAVRWQFVEVFMVTNSFPGGPPRPERLAQEIGPILRGFSITNVTVNSSKATNEIAAVLSDSYVGLYVLMEKIKRGKERVNIARIRPEHDLEPEVSGGYIIKKDDRAEGEKGLLTGQELKVRFEEPKESELTSVQRKWLTRYLDDFEKVLFGVNFRGVENGYRKYVEIESFIDFHWMVEVARNADGYLLSQYMHKDRGGKLTMGPLWDWDNGFGNTFFQSALKTNDWKFESAGDPDYTWFRRLFEDPDFLQRYVDRWSELRTNVFATSNVLAMVDRITNPMRAAQVRNNARWPTRAIGVGADELFQRDVSWLKEWTTSRLAWIDSQEFPKPLLQVNSPTNGVSVSMACLVGRLFYTTNGIDPRISGGGVAPSAIEYSRPVEVRSKLTVTARVRSNFGLWSAPVVVTAEPASSHDARVP